MRSIRDTIDEKIREYAWDNEDEATKLKIDTFSYAMLIEELGRDPEIPFTHYRGLVIKVDPEIDDLCEIL